MVERSASWKRLLEASWSRAKTISKETLEIPEPGSSSSRSISNGKLPAPSAERSPDESVVKVASNGASDGAALHPPEEATQAPGLDGAVAAAPTGEAALPPISAPGGLLARILRRQSSVGSQVGEGHGGESPEARDSAALRDSIEEQNPTSVDDATGLSDSALIEEPAKSLQEDLAQPRSQGTVLDRRSSGGHAQAQPTPQTSTGIRSKWGKTPQRPASLQDLDTSSMAHRNGVDNKNGRLNAAPVQPPIAALKRQLSNPAESSEPKRARDAEAPAADAKVDLEGRSFDLQTVVVCFSGVAELYTTTVLGKSQAKGDKLFDWEGIRRCVRHLRCVLDLQVIGVVFENWRAPDRGTGSHGIPADITGLCTSILETPRLTGGKHKVADREMALKCAWRRNCRFVDNDDASDWLHELGDERCRLWLEASQDIVLMRFCFEGTLGVFRVVEPKENL